MKASIQNNIGLNWSCLACYDYYQNLLGWLEEARKQSSLVKKRWKIQVKSNRWIQSWRQNHNGGRKRISENCLDGHGEGIGNRQCIELFTNTSPNTLNTLRKSFKDGLLQPEKYPAEVIQINTNLLDRLVYEDDDDPDEWTDIKYRRAYVKRQAEIKGNSLTHLKVIFSHKPSSSAPEFIP